MKMFLLSALMLGLSFGAFGQIDLVKNITTEAPEKWEITPKKGITKGMGCLNLVFADSVIWSVDIYNSSKKFLDNHSIMDRRNTDDTKNYYELTPGIYNFKLNTVMVENVPIEEGKETRLRTGVLDIITAGNWELRSELNQKFLTSGNKPKKMALPIGNYLLGEGKNKRLLQIKEVRTEMTGSVQEFEKWEIIQESKGLDNKLKNGKLDTRFPMGNWNNVHGGNTNTSWYINIATGKKHNDRIFSSGWPFESTIRYWDSLDVLISATAGKEFYTLLPGIHQIKLNNIYIKDLPIEEGKTTRIKSGLLKITCSQQYNNSIRWEIYDKEEGGYLKPSYFTGKGPAVAVLPVGTFGLKIWGSYPIDQITVKDGEEVIIHISHSRLTVISDKVVWALYDANGYPGAYLTGGNYDKKVSVTIDMVPNGNYLLKYHTGSGSLDQFVKHVTIPMAINEVRIASYDQQ